MVMNDGRKEEERETYAETGDQHADGVGIDGFSRWAGLWDGGHGEDWRAGRWQAATEDYIGTALLVVTLRHAPVTGLAARIYIWDAIRSIADTTRSSCEIPQHSASAPLRPSCHRPCAARLYMGGMVCYHKVNGPFIAR